MKPSQLAETLNVATNAELEEFVASLDRRTRDYLEDNMGRPRKELMMELDDKESEIIGLEDEVGELREEIAKLEHELEELKDQKQAA